MKKALTWFVGLYVGILVLIAFVWSLVDCPTGSCTERSSSSYT